MTAVLGDPALELTHIREAFARVTAAIQACSDALEAKDAATELQSLVRDLIRQASEFRGDLAVRLMDEDGMTVTGLAAFLGVSRPRAYRIIAAAQERRSA
jgi:hypothetical protein